MPAARLFPKLSTLSPIVSTFTAVLSDSTPPSARTYGVTIPALCSGAPTIASVLPEVIAMLVPCLSCAVSEAAVLMPLVVQGRAFCNTLHLESESLSTHTSSLLSHPLTGVNVDISLGCVKRTLLSLYIGIRTPINSASVKLSSIVNLLGLGTSNILATLPIGCCALTIT